MIAALVDWDALVDVILISAAAGVAIAVILGVGIVASLRAQEHEGNVIGFHAVTLVSLVLVAGAIVVGLYFIAEK